MEINYSSVSKVKFGHPSMPPDSDYDLILFKESLDDIENSITSLFSLDIEGAVQNTLLSNQDVKTLMEGVLAPKLNLLPIAEIEAEHRNVRFKAMLNEQIALLDYLEEQSTAVISGAAGTGKTLMAIEKAKRSAELHEKVLFLCYNSKLKEHLRQTYPDEYIDYYTIDGFACSLCQTSESDYEKLQEKLLECGVNGTFPYKHVIIDEGQDFGQDKIDDAEIIDLLYDIVYDKNNGSSFYLFYDKNQLVQGRKLPDCIANADCRLTLYRNCRNTENIATSSLRFLGSKKPPKVFERAIRGSSPTLLISTDEASQIRTINEMIDKYSDAYGNSIVILTCSTVENSLLSSFRDGEYYRYNGKKVLFTTCRKFKGLSESIIKQIHSLVLIDRPDDKGVFRKIPVRIMGAYTEPVQPYLIEPKINELLLENEHRKETMNPIERIARFHLEFEGIHPFIDGNGRTGRLILNLDLIRNGYPPINVKFAERKKYYDAFDEYYRNGNANKMTELIAGYVNERLDDYLRVLGK